MLFIMMGDLYGRSLGILGLAAQTLLHSEMLHFEMLFRSSLMLRYLSKQQ